jgi:hypothetical protein
MPLSVYILGVGVFAISTSEFVIMGLLPNLAGDLHVSIPTAGLLVSGYAAGVILGAPLLTPFLIRLPRKQAMVALMALFTAGSIVCTLAPGYAVLRGCRGMIAGVGRAGRLDQQDVDLILGHRPVLHALGDHVQLAGAQMDLAVTQLNRQSAFEDKEEIVGVFVRVPDELALELDHHDVVTVEPLHDLRRPVLRKRRQFFVEIDNRHDALPFQLASVRCARCTRCSG